MSGVPETIFVEAAVVADMGENESKSMKKKIFILSIRVFVHSRML